MANAQYRPLEYLGLDDAASSVYLACLELGRAKASDIAYRTGITRTSVYRLLEVLQQKNLVGEEIIEGKKIFFCTDPSIITELLKQHSAELTLLLPQLMSLYTEHAPGIPRFRFYGDASGIKKVFEEILSNPTKTYDLFGSIYDHELIQTVGESYLTDWTRRRVASGVHHRTLRPSTERTGELKPLNPIFTDSGEAYLREVRYVATGINLPVLIHVFDGRVTIMSGRLGRQFAVVLESQEIFDAMKSIFEHLWQTSGT